MATWVGQLMRSLRKAEHVVNKLENASYDQFKLAAKMPHNPNVVVLGGAKQLPLVEKYFEQHRVLMTQECVAAESTLSAPRQVARTLVEEYRSVGKVLADFPRNVEEAAELDLYLEGVNLAVHFGQTLSAQEQEVADYYAQRGLLLSHKEDPRLDQEDQKEHFDTALLAAIKI